MPLLRIAALFKHKILLLAQPNIATNHTLNTDLQKSYNAVNGNPQLDALLASQGLKSLWYVIPTHPPSSTTAFLNFILFRDRLGTHITEWVKDDSKVQKQASEAVQIYEQFLATRGVQMTPDGMKAMTPEGQAFAEQIGFGSGKCDWGCEGEKCTHGM